VTIPRHNPVNAFTMGGIVRDAGLSEEAFRDLLSMSRPMTPTALSWVKRSPDLVTFVQQDLFATDVSTATVVALYLSPEINLCPAPEAASRAAPRQPRGLPNQFDMGDWLPERSFEVSVAGAARRVFLWRIPGPSAPARPAP
jgi:hypothetical protein